jgi:hypothetical protein
MSDKHSSAPARPTVDAQLIETTPDANGIGHWLLASPMILFLGWLWIDFFAYLSPIPWRGVDYLLAIPLYFVLFVLPLGLASHRIVTSLPQIFQHAGWDVQPLEAVPASQQYLVRYRYVERRRAASSFRRNVLRAGQGWVYLEIAAIFVGAVVMIPLFFSATEFGFGQ